jgi:hypothetical protein
VAAGGATGENLLVFTSEILRFAQDDNARETYVGNVRETPSRSAVAGAANRYCGGVIAGGGCR